MTTTARKISAAAISRILSRAGIKKALPGKSWSTGFTTEGCGPDEVLVWFDDTTKPIQESLEQIAKVINDRTDRKYFARVIVYGESGTKVVSVVAYDAVLPVAPEGKELSENEEIILGRMLDEDGTEYRLYFGPGAIPQGNSEFPFVRAPRDQVEPLIARGLVYPCYTAEDALRAVRGETEVPKNAARLSDKGREVLAKLQARSAPKEKDFVVFLDGEIAGTTGDFETAVETLVEGYRVSVGMSKEEADRRLSVDLKLGDWFVALDGRRLRDLDFYFTRTVRL